MLCGGEFDVHGVDGAIWRLLAQSSLPPRASAQVDYGAGTPAIPVLSPRSLVVPVVSTTGEFSGNISK